MWPNSRSIALPELTLFPPVLTLFPPFFGPIPASVVFPVGLPLFLAEPGVDASPRLWRFRCACDIALARRYGRGMSQGLRVRDVSRNAIAVSFN
jgi:hypothetical protein